MARATAQPIDDLIARDGMHPSGEWQLCVIGIPLIVDCEQKLLHEILYLLGLPREAPAQERTFAPASIPE
jgi:hypothetical protein